MRIGFSILLSIMLLATLQKQVHAQILPFRIDSAVFYNNRILIDPDNMAADSISDRKYNAFYDSLSRFFTKDKFTKKVFQSVFHEPSDKKDVSQQKSELINKAKSRITGSWKIDSIVIRQLNFSNVFLADRKTHKEKNFLKWLANTTHIHTREGVIKNRLFIKKGDHISNIDLVDAERLLRRLAYIKDARLYLIQKKNLTML